MSQLEASLKPVVLSNFLFKHFWCERAHYILYQANFLKKIKLLDPKTSITMVNRPESATFHPLLFCLPAYKLGEMKEKQITLQKKMEIRQWCAVIQESFHHTTTIGLLLLNDLHSFLNPPKVFFQPQMQFHNILILNNQNITLHLRQKPDKVPQS